MSESEYKFDLHLPNNENPDTEAHKIDVLPEQVVKWIGKAIIEADYDGILNILKMDLNWDEIFKKKEAQNIIESCIMVLKKSVDAQKDPLLRRKTKYCINHLESLWDTHFPKEYVN
jgi:hypothetical protein